MSVDSELRAIPNRHLRQTLEAIAHVSRSGLKTDAARGYLVARIRWHLGDRAAFPTRPAAVRSADAAIIEDKARRAIEEHHHLLPPVKNP